jgi:hypothetical protein
MLVKSGEYRLNESLRLGNSDTDVVFEKGCVLRPTAGFTGFAVEIVRRRIVNGGSRGPMFTD